MKKIVFISTVAFAMLSCMASSPRQSLQARLFGTWCARESRCDPFANLKVTPLQVTFAKV